MENVRPAKAAKVAKVEMLRTIPSPNFSSFSNFSRPPGCSMTAQPATDFFAQRPDELKKGDRRARCV
jgi:hypothetical protein